MIGIRSGKNVLAGLLFAGFGVLGLVLGRDYEAGTAFRMGAGYFPMVVGWALVLLGLSLLVMGLSVEGERMKGVRVRPLFFVLASVVLFAVLVRPFGLIVATVVMTLVARAGGWDWKPLEIALLALVLAGGAVLLFVQGLGLPVSVWPG